MTEERPGKEPKKSASAEAANPFAEIAENLQGAMAPWLSWVDVFNSAVKSRANPVVQDAMNAMTRPDKMIENMLSMSGRMRDMAGLPQFADLPNLESSSIPSLEPALELTAVLQQYFLVATPVWVAACKRFEAEIASRQQGPETVESAGEALELWNNILDKTLMEFNRSSRFSELQKKYLHASVKQKKQITEHFEQFARAVDAPTRSEMNDIYRRLHELHREVIYLRRKIDSGGAEPRKQSTPSNSVSSDGTGS